MRSLDEFYKYIEKQERALREHGPVQEESFEGGADNVTPSDEALQRAVEDAERAGQRPATPVKLPDLPETPKPVSAVVEPPAPRPAGRFRYVMRGGVTIPVPIDEEESTPARVEPAPPIRPPASRPVSPLTEDERVALGVDSPAAEPAPAARTRTVHRAIAEDAPPRAMPEMPASPSMTDGEAAKLWGRLPRHIQLLVGMSETEEEVAQKYYRRGFKESRHQLVERLLDPTLTLEDTARILGVCPTTVRRYTNRGQLPHHRTVGQQRRFRLSDVLAFLEKQAARTGGIGAGENGDGPG